MRQRSRYTVHGAILAALYVTLTHFQNMLFPNSASFAIQVRLSEALCIFAFFTPAAIPGIALGCLLFNLTFSAALPLDFLAGSLATLIATWGMWKLRRVRLWGLPLPGLLLPALTNAVLVGWELTVYIGGGFWINAVYVAAGELIALLIPGAALYRYLRRRRFDRLLFG